MREIVHIQAGQCGNQIGAKVRLYKDSFVMLLGWMTYFFNIFNHFKALTVIIRFI